MSSDEIDVVQHRRPSRTVVDAATIGWFGWIALLVAFAMMRQGQPIYDDPYIFYRYAQNLANGHGWSFNPTSKTDNAVTSVLMVLVLTGFSLGGMHIPAASSAVFFVSTWLCASLVGLAFDELGYRAAGVAGGTLIAVSALLTSFWGMETSLYLALLAGLLYAVVSRRSVWLIGALWGLLVLARPDGVLFGGLVIASVVVLDRPRSPRHQDCWKIVVAALVPVASWCAIVWVKIGTPLPSTLAAKVAQRQSGRWPAFVDSDGWSFSGWAPPGFWGRALALAIVAAALIAIATGLAGRTSRSIALIGVGLITGSWLIYGVLLDVASYPWYFGVPYFGLMLLAALGVEVLWRIVPVTRSFRSLIFASIGLLSVVLSLGAVATGPNVVRSEYPAVGEWLRVNTDPAATVAATEIGAIGWYSERTMVDYLGLLDAAANDHLSNDDFTWWAAHYQPDYWVTNRVEMDEQFASSRCLSEHFAIVFSIGPEVVYQRRSAIPSDGSCQ